MMSETFSKLDLAPAVKKAATITGVIIGAFIMMLFLPWEQTTKGEGKLIAYHPNERDYNILAPISGLVREYNVTEEQFVTEGTLLFEMVDMDSEYLPKLGAIMENIDTRRNNIRDSLAILDERRSNLQENLTTGLEIHDKKIQQIEDRLKVLHLKVRSQESNHKTAVAHFERVSKLFAEGIESQRSYEVAKNDSIKIGLELESTRIDIATESKNLQIHQKEKARFLNEHQNRIQELSSAILDAENSFKMLDQEHKHASIDFSRNSAAKVFATKDGYVMRVLKNDRDHYVKQGEPILHFTPEVTKKALLLRIRSIDMPLMKTGLPVRIQFYGWPSLQVSGWPKITYGTFGGVVEKIDPIAHANGTYYVYVVEDPKEPWPSNDVLKIGTDASAWVRLSTVSIGYEIWRLHNALPPSMITKKEK